MTHQERLAAIQHLLDHTQAHKDQAFAQARLEQPHLTEQNLEALWEQAAYQLGLPDTKPARGPARA